MKRRRSQGAARPCERHPPGGHPPGGHAPGEHGFTLLEALVAMALTGFLLGMLGVVTGHWMKNWKAGLNRLQSADMVGLGVDRIAADLAAAEYVSLGGDDGRTFFQGTETSVIFVRSAVGPNASAGLEIIRLSEEDDVRGRVLVRSRAPFAPVTAAAVVSGAVEFSNPIVLVRAPFQVSFAFAGRDRVWKDNWLDPKLLPNAVRVSIRNETSDDILPVSTATLISVELPADCIQAKAAGCTTQ